MNQQELERLIASLTDEELQQIRDHRPDEADVHPAADAADAHPGAANADPARTATRQFIKSLVGRDDD